MMVSRNRKYDFQELAVLHFRKSKARPLRLVCKELELRICESKGNKAKRLRGCSVEKSREEAKRYEVKARKGGG